MTGSSGSGYVLRRLAWGASEAAYTLLLLAPAIALPSFLPAAPRIGAWEVAALVALAFTKGFSKKTFLALPAATALGAAIILVLWPLFLNSAQGTVAHGPLVVEYDATPLATLLAAAYTGIVVADIYDQVRELTTEGG